MLLHQLWVALSIHTYLLSTVSVDYEVPCSTNLVVGYVLCSPSSISTIVAHDAHTDNTKRY